MWREWERGRERERERESEREEPIDHLLSAYDRFFREAFGIAAEDYLVGQLYLPTKVFVTWCYIVHIYSTHLPQLYSSTLPTLHGVYRVIHVSVS